MQRQLLTRVSDDGRGDATSYSHPMSIDMAPQPEGLTFGSLLSLMSLVALVLGAVGVGMAMRAHLQQRLDSIAIMKSLGAGSAQIMKIYVIQTLMLGLAGGALGVLLGAGVQMAFPYLLHSLINVTGSWLWCSTSLRMT